MKYLVILSLMILWAGMLRAQRDDLPEIGKISYISSQNVYVKFKSTENLKAGDTLYIQEKNQKIPVLVVKNLSSTSCVCVPISEIKLAVARQIYGMKKSNANKVEDKPKLTVNRVKQVDKDTSDYAEKEEVKKTEFIQKISGSVAASSYTYFTGSESKNSSRFRYQLSLNAKNIGNSRFSFETSAAFQHTQDNWAAVQENVFQALKIYNLSAIYSNNKNIQFVLGRRFNPKLSSVGAIDGLQYEGNNRSFFWGAIAGSRPNYADYSVDFDLLQFGVYGGHKYTNSNGTMQSTVAFFEQMNAMKTDRRFAYFQHSNSLIKNIYFFGSAEIDLYKNIDDQPVNALSLTSAYLVLNYRLSKKLSLSASYDNRKNIIYYESYKSFINQLLEIEARQGFSLQANYRHLKNLTYGLRAGYRLANNNGKETKNLYGFVSYTNIPIVKLNAIAAVNYMEASYVNGKIFNLNLSRDVFQGDLSIDCGYQFVDYQYLGAETTTIQNVVNVFVSWRFLKKITFSANYETTFEKQDQFSRLSLRIRKRF